MTPDVPTAQAGGVKLFQFGGPIGINLFLYASNTRTRRGQTLALSSPISTMRVTPRLRNALPASSSTVQASAALKERVRRPALLKKLAKAEDLAPLFKVSFRGVYRGIKLLTIAVE